MESSANTPPPDDPAQRYREVTALFDAVRDLPETEAQARVERHPSQRVREEVREMLAADRGNDSPLRTIVDVVGAIDDNGAPPEIPASVGEYKVTGMLGQGGGGVVLKGVCPKTGRDVAIKVLGIGAWSSRALGRFRQEIKLLGHLTHPGIAQILDAGTDRSGVSPHPYFVMEYVDGQSLSQWRRAAPRTAREVVLLFTEILEAVAFSHARGITHRDLKPSNILVSADGHAKILDFGVATVARDADPSLDPLRTLTLMLELGRTSDMAGGSGGRTATAAGAVVGTLPYMSPEQISGTQVADARSDLYSLGVMLYEALCGKLPYDLSMRSLTDAGMVIRSEIPTTIGRIDRSLRGDLEVIVSRLLEKRPVDRYQSAQDLLEDLGRYLRGQRTRIRQIPARIRAMRFARRYPAYVALCVFLGFVAIAAIGYAGYLVATERVADVRRAATEADSMRQALSTAAVAVARGQPLESLAALSRIAEPGRSWAWHAMNRHFSRGAVVSYTFYAPVDLHPRGDRVFLREGVGGGTVAVYDTHGGLRESLDLLRPNVPFAVSPDGVRMVRGFASEGQLFVRSTADGAVLDVLASPLAEIDAMAWSSDGATLALANRSGEVGVIDVATGAAETLELGWMRIAEKPVEVRMVDRTVLVAIEGGDAIHAWRLPTSGVSGELARIPLGDLTVARIAVADVGGVVFAAVGTEQGAIAMVDVGRGALLRRFDFASSPVTTLAIEPARGILVAGCGERVDRRRGIVQAWDLATGEPLGTLGVARAPLSAAFSADGETLYLGEVSGELKRFSVERELLAPSVGGPSLRIEDMSFAGGGRMVVATADGLFWWDWDGDRQASRARLERWPLPSGAVGGRPFAVLSAIRAQSAGERQVLLAVVDGASARVRFYADSGAEVGDLAIEAPGRADGTFSIAATERGFVLGVDRRIASYTVAVEKGRVRANMIASTECAGSVRSVSATPDGRAVVATIMVPGEASPSLVGLAQSGGSISKSWQQQLALAPEGKSSRAAISTDGECAFLVSGAADMAVHDATLGANLITVGDFAPWSIDRAIADVRVSPDGRALALRCAAGTVRIVEASAEAGAGAGVEAGAPPAAKERVP